MYIDNGNMTFEEALENLINKYSKENQSNTPDYILAKYLSDCLDSYSSAIKSRDKWFNFKPFNQSNDKEKEEIS